MTCDILGARYIVRRADPSLEQVLRKQRKVDIHIKALDRAELKKLSDIGNIRVHQIKL